MPACLLSRGGKEEEEETDYDFFRGQLGFCNSRVRRIREKKGEGEREGSSSLFFPSRGKSNFLFLVVVLLLLRYNALQWQKM